MNWSFSLRSYLENDKKLISGKTRMSYTRNTDRLNSYLYTDYENSIENFERISNLAEFSLLLPARLAFKTRLYSGRMIFPNSPKYSKQELTESYGFFPYALGEARTRIDYSDTEAVENITAISSDFHVPLSLFSSGLGLIGNRLFGKYFYDVSYEEKDGKKTYYKAS